MSVVTGAPRARARPKTEHQHYATLIVMRCENCRYWNSGQCFRHVLAGAKFQLDGEESRLLTAGDFGCVQGRWVKVCNDGVHCVLCQDCKYWKKLKLTKWQNLYPPYLKGWGECNRNWSRKTDAPSSLFEIQAVEGGEFYTAPNFGCVAGESE